MSADKDWLAKATENLPLSPVPRRNNEVLSTKTVSGHGCASVIL